MDVYMTVHFNSLINESFTIKNPPVIPITGDHLDFDFKEFIKDEKELQKLDEYKQNYIFLAEMLTKRYNKDHVEVIVVLFEEQHFKEVYPELARMRQIY